MRRSLLFQKMFPLYVFLSLGCQYTALYAQEDWTLKRDSDGIKVFTRKSSNSKFNLIKVECIVNAKLTAIAALLLDVDNHVDWVYSTKVTRLLKKVSEVEIYYYQEIRTPWPVKNRDLPVHLIITQDPVTKVMTVEANCVPNYIPRKEDIVRVPFSNALWKITPAGNDKVSILYELKADTGGSVPAWIFNMFITKGPYESFKGLIDRVRLPRYAGARIPSIKN